LVDYARHVPWCARNLRDNGGKRAPGFYAFLFINNAKLAQIVD
jgi:hypothetical protein